MIHIDNCQKLACLGSYLECVPYEVMRSALYAPSELYDAYNPYDAKTFHECYDTRVYHHYLDNGKNCSNPLEALARSLHDYSIRLAMNRFLDQFEKWQVVGIMGGHALKRTDKCYRDIVLISKQLTEKGYLMVSGGGPGAMEATHLGAWMAGRAESDVDEALRILGVAPSFSDDGWLRTAMEVIRLYPNMGFDSLGVPTWLYGHEPATPFATQIAKLFENSIREEQLLTIAYGGLVFVPGSAGTIQEVFQEAVQDHYKSFGFSSPMVFLGHDFWQNEVPVMPFFEHLIANGRYKNLILHCVDSHAEAIDAILQFKDTINTTE